MPPHALGLMENNANTLGPLPGAALGPPALGRLQAGALGCGIFSMIPRAGVAFCPIITYLRIVDYMAVIFLGQPSVEVAVEAAAK